MCSTSVDAAFMASHYRRKPVQAAEPEDPLIPLRFLEKVTIRKNKIYSDFVSLQLRYIYISFTWLVKTENSCAPTLPHCPIGTHSTRPCQLMMIYIGPDDIFIPIMPVKLSSL